MLRDPNELGTPHDWLKRAKSNLIRAKQPKPEEVLWEDLCFDTQQAAEKALKAVLVTRRIPFRFVHDIAELLTLLENQGVLLPEEIKVSAELTDYSVESRYPGPLSLSLKKSFRGLLKLLNQLWLGQSL